MALEDSITLKATPVPADAPWPNYMPEWKVNGLDIGFGGTCPAQGFSDCGTYEVWAYCGSASLGKQVTVKVIDVAVTFADVTEDKITVDLRPHDASISGTLDVQLTDPDTQTIADSISKSGAIHDISFNIPNLLSVMEHKKVTATWTVGGIAVSGEYDYHIQVLGSYRHTQYNTPNEDDCAGDPLDFCYTSGTCTDTTCQWSTGGSGKEGWLTEVAENGGGYSSTLGFVTLEAWCHPPEECNSNNPVLRDLDEGLVGCPKCSGQSLVAGTTVAVNPSHPNLSCGNTVFIYDPMHGNKYGITCTVTDHGFGLSTSQLDHYSGVSGCNRPGDRFPQNRMTIKLFQ